MEKIFILFCMFFNLVLFGQINFDNINPKDTCCTHYYKNGMVKKFDLKKQFLTSRQGQKMSIYLDSVCDKQKQKIRWNSTNDNNWENIIHHFSDSLIILHRNYSENGAYKEQKDFRIILSSKDCPQINVTVFIDKDSLVNRLIVSKDIPNSYFTEKYYADLYFNKASLDKNFDYVIENNNYLKIDFYKKSFIKRMVYSYLENNQYKTKVITFYLNNKPKEYGHYFEKSTGRIGKWYTYYENDKLSSEGSYSGSEFDEYGKEFNIKKTGKWVYYTKEGCVENEEIWDNGKLIKTSINTSSSKSSRSKKSSQKSKR